MHLTFPFNTYVTVRSRFEFQLGGLDNLNELSNFSTENFL